MGVHRHFSEEDQQAFAQCSGDANPVHVDAIAARRTMFGGCVVHGVHGFLWALNQWFADRPERRALAFLDVRFLHVLPVGASVYCEHIKDDGEGFELALVSDDVTVTQIFGAWREAGSAQCVIPVAQSISECRERTFDEVAEATGEFPLQLDPSTTEQLFPALWRHLPHVQIATILAATRLIGMECPGLHSVFAAMRLQFGEPTVEAVCRWRVTQVDDRVSAVSIAIQAAGAIGTLRAFVRPTPRKQPSLSEVARTVKPDEFKHQRALVVGGSRGLGEVTAKIIAAGGGAVCLTYNIGAADAQCVTAELRAGRYPVTAVRFNIAIDKLPELPWIPTHVYFFASPHIGRGSATPFSTKKFSTFSDCYVIGFANVLLQLLERTSGDLVAFYPSTSFLDDDTAQFSEYCAAKAAGEITGLHLSRRFRRLKCHAPRLPRLATDQSSGLLSAPTEEPLPVLLSAIRSVAG